MPVASDRSLLTSVSLDSYFYLTETGVAAVACRFVAASPTWSSGVAVVPLLWVLCTAR